MTLTKIVKIAAIACGLACTSMGASAGYSCSGTVGGISLAENSGEVLIADIGGTQLKNTRYCSILTETNSVNVTACKTFYASMLAAMTSDRVVEIWINNSLTCTTNPEWANVTGFYYSVIK